MGGNQKGGGFTWGPYSYHAFGAATEHNAQAPRLLVTVCRHAAGAHCLQEAFVHSSTFTLPMPFKVQEVPPFLQVAGQLMGTLHSRNDPLLHNLCPLSQRSYKL